MKRFLYRTILFLLLPLLLLGILEAFVLPPNYFTYRSWEALIYKNPIPHYGFYPDMHIVMNEQGDLAHHTKYAVNQHNITWITDKLGFRNNTFIENPDVLLIGDSFTAGVSLNQDQTITNRVSSLLGDSVSVYNMAPSSFNNFNFFYQNKLINKPKIIIFSIVERLAPKQLGFYEEEKDVSLNRLRKWNSNLVFSTVNTVIDRFFAYNSIKWAASRANNKCGNGEQSPIDNKVFYMEGKKVKLYTLKDAESTAKVIISYKKFCDSLGIGFLFMPMPNKESVYYDFVPLSTQPQYLLQLDSILNKVGVSTINTLGIYNSLRNSINGSLYQLDDTHWNGTATNIIAAEIVKHPQFKLVLQKK